MLLRLLLFKVIINDLMRLHVTIKIFRHDVVGFGEASTPRALGLSTGHYTAKFT